MGIHSPCYHVSYELAELIKEYCDEESISYKLKELKWPSEKYLPFSFEFKGLTDEQLAYILSLISEQVKT